ncbi:MAG: stage VI sporulation protein F [Erysipelotrichaceae bacterium]|nr:stage VI sporulation protein F [Erysipelotrichaceae bacterium]
MLNNRFFDKVEQKTNVKKEDIIALAKTLQNKDLSDEKELRNLINSVSKLANTPVSPEKEQKIIDAIKKDKVPRNLDKML